MTPSVVLRVLQLAAQAAHDPYKVIRDNERVGWLNGADGFLD